MALPQTGKTHQIRLHAKDLGIPILGDTLYGGSPFIRICLHAHELKFELAGSTYEAKSTPPQFFEQLNLIQDTDYCRVINALFKRQILFPKLFDKKQTLRILHNEFEHMQIDLYGEVAYLYWFADTPPNEVDKLLFKKILKVLQIETLFVRQMKNRGVDPLQSHFEVIGKPIADSWVAQENGVSYLLKTHSGLSPGLFLDQRLNRQWVYENSKDKKVLNLFSYTGGFSVCAALGQAQEVTTVDVSSNFIDWSKENFKLNKLDPNQYSFWSADSLTFLEGSIKRQKKFDIIICDPPSFSRGKKGVFKIETDFNHLIQLCYQALAPKGVLLFSTNLEKWTTEDLIYKAQKALSITQSRITKGLESYDFELPNEPRLMKSIYINK